jgi:maleate cis-trans isomerase
MKIRIISSREEINSLRPNEKAVHLAFRASNVDFLNLIQKVPRLQMVQVPTSYMKTISKAIHVFLEMQGIDLLQGDVWGHRKDLDEYFTIEDVTIKEIHSLAASGVSMDVVADSVQNKTRLNPDLIKYVARTKLTA